MRPAGKSALALRKSLCVPSSPLAAITCADTVFYSSTPSWWASVAVAQTGRQCGGGATAAGKAVSPLLLLAPLAVLGVVSKSVSCSEADVSIVLAAAKRVFILRTLLLVPWYIHHQFVLQLALLRSRGALNYTWDSDWTYGRVCVVYVYVYVVLHRFSHLCLTIHRANTARTIGPDVINSCCRR